MDFESGLTAIVTRPAAADEVGDRGEPTTHEVPDCSISQNSSHTDNDRRRTTVTGVTLTCTNPAADLKAGDKVEIGGGTYLVDGKPWPVKSPFSDWTPGLVANLKEVK